MPDDKTLIASSEFDPNEFVQGMDKMIAALERLSTQENAIKLELKNINAALVTNRQEFKNTTTQIASLDKASTTYKDDLVKLTAQKKLLAAQAKELKTSLGTQQTQLKDNQDAANKYRSSIQNITLAVKQASDTKGKSFFNVIDLKKQIADIQASAGKIQTILKGKVSTAEIDKFVASLDSANNEFEELGKVITFVKSKLETLDPDSQEFAELNRIVEQGELVLSEYNKTLDNTDKKSVSLRSQLAVLRNTLSELEEQGKENTQEFQDMAIAAGKLQDQMEDTQERIKVLASDTKALDFGVAAVRGVASAFGLATGAAALFGVKNEELERTLVRLNAIMVILNSLTEIQNALKKSSTLAVLGETIATKAATAAQRVYNVVVGTSTGLVKGLRTALLASGIGAFLLLIGLAAKAMDLFGDKTEDTKLELDKFNLALDQSNRKLAQAAKDLQFRQGQAVEAAKQRGATEAEISDLVVKGYEKEARANEESAKKKVKDATGIISKLTKGVVIFDPKSVDNINQARNALNRLEQAQFRLSLLPDSDDTVEEFSKAIDIAKDIVSTFEASKDAEQKALDETAQFRTKRIEDARKDEEKNLELFRAYLDRLTALQRELRDKELAAKPQDQAAIKESFKNQLQDVTDDIDTEVKRGKLSKARGEILKGYLGQINKVDLDAAMKEFKEEVIAFQKEFDQQLLDLQIENATRRAELIRDQFIREAELIKISADAEIAQLIRDRDAIIKRIEDQPGLIPTVKTAQIEAIKAAYFKLIEDIGFESTRKQEAIAAEVFEKLQDETKTIFANVQLVVSETATAEIQVATEQFTTGKINYKEYQEELTAIAARETDRRIATALREAEALLKAVQAEIPLEQDPERLEGLKAQELELKNRISGLKREESTASAEAINKETQARAKRIQELASYANAIGGIINQVVSFWQQVNEAEQRSLEKSIQLQERRVEAATKIAERGNSEYLRLEEDRLQELQTKQENAARRQIAINAVLQTSQALTAFISALAQGIALGGPLGGIAIAAAVIAAIASGYAIVQSLQPPTPTFKKGTKYVEREGHPAGVDTVPARLTEGEAVLPVDVNKEYHPAVKAIFDRKIPAKEINNFVNNYRVNQRVLPTVNYERMSEATQVMISYDGELLQATKEQTRKLDENNMLLEEVKYQLKHMGFSFNLDRNGLAISMMKAVEQYKIDRKT